MRHDQSIEAELKKKTRIMFNNSIKKIQKDLINKLEEEAKKVDVSLYKNLA